MIVRLDHLVDRRLLPVIIERMREEPVILLEGARTVGKSTLLRELASRTATEVIDLDDLPTRDAVAADPTTMLGGPSPVLIDEYQHVPAVLDVIKAELNKSSQPGRFVLTGSARHESLPVAAQALTGRLHRIPVRPLSQAEIDEQSGNLLAELIRDPAIASSAPNSLTTREEYIERIVAGGLPAPLQRGPGPSRQRWFDDYIRLTLERDVHDVSRIRQASALPILLQRLAGQTAQVLNTSNLSSDIGLSNATTDTYIRLLEAVFLVQRLEAWGTTLTSRSSSRPKIHVVDSGIAARLLRLSADKLAQRSAAALTELGHLLETFVIGEIIGQSSLIDDITGVGHWRTHDGHEVDLVVEHGDGTITAFEIKASQRVSGNEMAPLRLLRDTAGEQFRAGYTFFLGQRSYTFEDRLHVLPVDRLWMK